MNDHHLSMYCLLPFIRRYLPTYWPRGDHSLYRLIVANSQEETIVWHYQILTNTTLLPTIQFSLCWEEILRFQGSFLVGRRWLIQCWFNMCSSMILTVDTWLSFVWYWWGNERWQSISDLTLIWPYWINIDHLQWINIIHDDLPWSNIDN